MATDPIIDFDAGENWGVQDYKLLRPFKWQATVYDTATIRVPNGGDVERHVRGEKPMAEIMALAATLTGWPPMAFEMMYAADRAEIMSIVGKHMTGPSALKE